AGWAIVCWISGRLRGGGGSRGGGRGARTAATSCGATSRAEARPRRVDPRLEAMVEAARAGGAVALEHYRRGFSVSLKPDRSPVTEAGREAERAIVGVLRARCPDHGGVGGVLGESGPRGRRFLLDPVHRLPD